MLRRACAIAVITITVGCQPVNVSAPVRIPISSNATLTEQKLKNCIDQSERLERAQKSVVLHPSGGFIVSITGRDLMFSGNNKDVWESIGFFILPLKDGKNTSLLLSDIRGSSTFSQSDTIPPAGDRWEPFDDNEQALAASNIQIEFAGIGQCVSKIGTTA